MAEKALRRRKGPGLPRRIGAVADPGFIATLLLILPCAKLWFTTKIARISPDQGKSNPLLINGWKASIVIFIRAMGMIPSNAASSGFIWRDGFNKKNWISTVPSREMKNAILHSAAVCQTISALADFDRIHSQQRGIQKFKWYLAVPQQGGPNPVRAVAGPLRISPF